LSRQAVAPHQESSPSALRFCLSGYFDLSPLGIELLSTLTTGFRYAQRLLQCINGLEASALVRLS
jgi:hypothetical protein